MMKILSYLTGCPIFDSAFPTIPIIRPIPFNVYVPTPLNVYVYMHQELQHQNCWTDGSEHKLSKPFIQESPKSLQKFDFLDSLA
jgi:hypothetical protein